jgi:hypothetical protein
MPINHSASGAPKRAPEDDCFYPATVRSMQMLDIIMLALGLAFFALSVGYTIACDRL